MLNQELNNLTFYGVPVFAANKLLCFHVLLVWFLKSLEQFDTSESFDKCLNYFNLY